MSAISPAAAAALAVPGDVDLLGAAEEVELGAAIEAGVLAQARLDTHDIAPYTVEDLRAVAAAGERARQRFILANVRLVRWAARRRYAAGAAGGLSFEDLVSEGMLGLIHAVEMWDFTRGVKFSTYAVFWLRQQMGRAAARNTAAVVPFHILDRLAQLHAATAELTEQLRRTPTDHELAAQMGSTTKAIGELRTISRRAVSLDAPISDSTAGCLLDLVAVDTRAADEAACAADLTARVHALIHTLTARQRLVVALRFGLFGEDVHTVEQTASALHVTPAQVREVLTAALQQLRSGERVGELHLFLEDVA